MRDTFKKIENNRKYREKNPHYQGYYQYKRKCIKEGTKPMTFAEYVDDMSQRKK